MAQGWRAWERRGTRAQGREHLVDTSEFGAEVWERKPWSVQQVHRGVGSVTIRWGTLGHESSAVLSDPVHVGAFASALGDTGYAISRRSGGATVETCQTRGMPSLSYDVTVSRDGAVWLLEIAPIGGVAEARWLGEAESVARAFIADFEDADPEKLDIALTVIYPGEVALELDRAEAFRKTSDDALDAEWEALGNAALALDAAGVTRRDIGDILGLAVPRVRRLLRGGPRENQSRLAAE